MTRSGAIVLSKVRGPLLVVAVVALSGCALLARSLAPPAMPPLAPSTLGATHSALQVVHAAFGDREAAFQCLVNVDPDRVTVVGMDAMGQRWFTLRYDGKKVEAETREEAKDMPDPGRILVDLQLALWPLPALQHALAGSAWQVTEPAPATRRLRRDGRLVAEIHYDGADPWQGRLWLSNFETGYSLAVESKLLP